MTRRNCLVTVHYERAQNKLRHMDLRWKRAGREMEKKKDAKEREIEIVSGVRLERDAESCLAEQDRNPRSRYAHVIKRIKGTPGPPAPSSLGTPPKTRCATIWWAVINFSSFAPRPIHSPFIRVRTDYEHARAYGPCACAWVGEIADQQTERPAQHCLASAYTDRLVDYLANVREIVRALSRDLQIL